MNVTLIVQFVAAARELPQVVGLREVRRIQPRDRDAGRFSVELPVLLNVTFWDVLLDPTVTLPKLRLAGVRVTAGATPVRSAETD